MGRGSEPERRERAIELHRAGWKVGAIWQAVGRSHTWLAKWRRRFRADGPAGLADRSSRLHRIWRQLRPRLVARILAARAALVSAGSDQGAGSDCQGGTCSSNGALMGVRPEGKVALMGRAEIARVRERARPWRWVWAILRPYLYILPTFFFLFIFTYWPILGTFYVSFFRWNMASPQMEFVGLANYAQAWSAPLFWEVLGNNLLFAGGTVPFTLALALCLALLINQKIRGLTIYRAALFYPTMIPMAAAAMIWLWILTPNYGLLNYYSRWLGLPDIHWLGHSKLALWVLVLVGVWKRVGYYMVIYLAGLQVIPEYLYEAAIIEGAGPWHRFWRVTLPLLSPTTFFVGVMAVIDAFQAIDQVYLMTGGGPGNATNLFIFYIYQNALRFFDFGYASAVSAILFVILLGLTVLAFRTLHRRVHYA